MNEPLPHLLKAEKNAPDDIASPANVRYRRAIRIKGLENATVRLFGEKGCECAVSTTRTNNTPIYDERFSTVHDEKYGTYLEGRNVSGTIYFLIGHDGTLDG